MIFVDTSVWISFFRGGEHEAALRELIVEDLVALAAPVRLELLGGAPSSQARRLARLLGEVTTFYPSRDSWELAEAWTRRSAAAGQRFAVADLLIGSLAHERGNRVWSLDGDFERLARVTPLKLYRPDR